MRRKEKLIDHGLIKLFLLALVMLTPLVSWAEDYPITVAGVQVTSDNAANIIGDNITAGKVSFEYDAENHMATLNLEGATINGDIVYSEDSESSLWINLNGASTVKRITHTSQSEAYFNVNRAETNTVTHSLTVSGNGTDAAISGFISECITGNDFYDVELGLYWKPTFTGDVITSLLITTNVFGGAGTESSHYVISTPTQLEAFSTLFNNNKLASDCYVELGDNINCSSLEEFSPIGFNSDHCFTGTFDGKNKTISNLTAVGSNDVPAGLFGMIGEGAVISDLTLDNCTISEGDESGAIVGSMSGGTIQNCTINECEVSTRNGQSINAGGIAGSMAGGTIKYCTVQGSSISATTEYEWGGGSTFAGGIAGKLHYSDGESITIEFCEVSNSTVTANNTNPDGMSAGGIYGAYEGEGTATITISNNEVKGETEIICIDGCVDCDIDYSSAGAIGCPYNEDRFEISNNTYEYTVTTKRKKGNADFIVGEGYTPRGIGGFFDTSEYEYVDGTDVTGSAEMYTQKVTLPGDIEGATVTAAGIYYGDATDTGIWVAPGQTATVKVIPSTNYAISSLTATNTKTTTAISTESVELGDGVMQYTFTMPDAPVTVTVETAEAYNLWIAGTQVTTANATNVLGDQETPTVVFTPADNTTSPATPATLTLNGATINGFIKWSEEAALTIKVIGTNSIDSSDSENDGENGGNCIYNTTYPKPSLTFERGDADNACSLSMVCGTGFQPVFNFTGPDFTGMFWAMSDATHALVATTLLGGGAGTSESPFLITSADELNTFAAYVNNATSYEDDGTMLNIDGTILTKYVKLSDNFASAWPSSSTLPQIKHFGGTFDGNEKTITGLKVNGFSLFKTTGGKNITVKDLTLDGLQLSFESSGQADPIGGIVDYLTASQTIDNCVVKNTTIECGTAYANPCIGGIAGYNTGGTITNCSVEDITINAQSEDSQNSGASSYAGGILGNLFSGTVSNCRVMGESVIKSSHAYSSEVHAGAIIGHRVDASSTLTNNYYDYSVSTKTKAIEEENYTTKSGYTSRALGYNLVQNPQTEEYEQLPDVTTDDGAVMYTKTLSTGTVSNATLAIWYPAVNGYNENGKFAPTQDAFIRVTPSTGYLVSSVSVTYTEDETQKTITPTLDEEKTGDGNYIYAFKMPDADATANATLSFDISSTAFTASIANATYTGSALIPTSVSLTPASGGDAIVLTNSTDKTDFTITGYQIGETSVDSPINAGAYTVTIQGSGDYAGTRTVSYTIVPATITDVTLEETSLPYNGNAQTVAIESVKAGDIVLGTDDYTVSYEKINDDETTTPITQENVKAVGSYNVVVTGKGNFTGTASATFNIVNRTLAGSEVMFHNHWATYFSADGDVELPEGIGAFVATGVGDGVVTVSQIKNIPEGEAVLLNDNTPTAGTVAFDPEEDTNLMEHAYEEFEVGEYYLIYGLFKGEMWRVTGTIPVGRNYLLLSYEGPQAPRLTIVIDGEGSTTGVNDVRGKMAEAGGDYYDLSGRKLQQKPAKSGLYIQNGKKVVVNNK